MKEHLQYSIQTRDPEQEVYRDRKMMVPQGCLRQFLLLTDENVLKLILVIGALSVKKPRNHGATHIMCVKYMA